MWTGVHPRRLWSTTRPWLTAWTSLVSRTMWRISGAPNDSSSCWCLYGAGYCNNNYTDAFEKGWMWSWACFTGLSVWSWLDIQTLGQLCFSWFIPSPRTSASWSAVTSGLYVQETFYPDHLLSSITCCVSIQVSRRPNFKELYQDRACCQRWLNKKRIKAFYSTVFADNLRHGTQFLLQAGATS